MATPARAKMPGDSPFTAQNLMAAITVIGVFISVFTYLRDYGNNKIQGD